MRRFDEINFKHIYWEANQCASFSGRDVFLFSYSFMYCKFALCGFYWDAIYMPISPGCTILISLPV
ncbi:hypothetical protein RHGRI_002933 [Rhododendron griersonianum]|uniref:Uncharacterized protein n=1 Tax=Rhododendron griersonianum TaxID=479676 RepID=A0AAV6LT62_9ERIC|nr:hypothetical protein RHGRI_002933 [Rhododendron griersonianum]